MKKSIVFVVLVLIAISVSSCGNIYEDAYEAEQLYKAKKAEPKLVRGTLEGYEAKFLSIYESMTRNEQIRYKAYRERENKRMARELEEIKRVKTEAVKMLNN